MSCDPAIPSLVVIPGSVKDDYVSLFALAVAYENSGLLISERGHESDRHEFAFPAVVCSSFAIELFLKFFIVFGGSRNGNSNSSTKIHRLDELWQKIDAEYQILIASMYRSSSSELLIDKSEHKKSIFAQALKNIGGAPFVKWRYVHELASVTFMSHAAISEVANALARAAEFCLKKQAEDLKLSTTSIRGQGEDKTDSKSTAQVTEQDMNLSAYSGVNVGLQLNYSEGWEGARRLILKNTGNLILVKGYESILLGRDSPLRRMPVNLSANQALFFDALRYTVEFLDITYARLYESLTQIALHPLTPPEFPERFANTFLDAWTFVYSVNRFRIMYMNIPGIAFGAPAPGVPTFMESTEAFKKLRRAADNLAVKAGLIASEGGNAVGELNWLTGVEIYPEMLAYHCTMRAGTFHKMPQQSEAPINSTLGWPTDGIRLSLGGAEANLSAVRKHIALRVHRLEAQLETAFNAPENEQVSIISDFFARRPVKICKK